MSEETTFKKNGTNKGLPKTQREIEALQEARMQEAAKHTADSRKLPDDAALEVRRLTGRIFTQQQQLGALDFDKAKLEAQATRVRESLGRDMGEYEAVVNQAAKALGLEGPGWRFDPQTGEFSRA